MIAILERSLFIQAYKFDYVIVPIDRFLDYTIEDILNDISTSGGEIRWAERFDSVLPHFEEPHELLFVDLNRNKVHFGMRSKVSYDAILSIIPINNDGYMLLNGRMGSDMVIQRPFFESVINEVKVKRRNRSAEACVASLFHIFKLDQKVDTPFAEESGHVFQVFSSNLDIKNRSFLLELVAYDKTPSNLPEGNAEYLCKVGLIAVINTGQSEKKLQKGYFYDWCVKNVSHLNDKSIGDALEYYLSATKDGDNYDVKLSESHSNLLNAIKVNQSEEFFKIAFYYIAFRSILQKYDFDISEMHDLIQSELNRDQIVVAKSLFLLAHTFPFERLYAGIHKLRKRRRIDTSVVAVSSLATASSIPDERIQNQAVAEGNSSSQEDSKVSNESLLDGQVEDKQELSDLSVDLMAQNEGGGEGENSTEQAPVVSGLPENEQKTIASSDEKKRLVLAVVKYGGDNSSPQLNLLIEQITDKKEESIGELVGHVRSTFQNFQIHISEELENELLNLESSI